MAQINLYRLRLQPTSATLSAWQSDTLFGHLCWAVYYENGRSGLDEFLRPFRDGNPPFVLSNGFPGDMFPRPLVTRRVLRAQTKPNRVQAIRNGKSEKHIEWLAQIQFQEVLHGLPLSSGAQIQPEQHLKVNVTLKNQINRLTGTTAGREDEESAGNLYSLTEFAFLRGQSKPYANSHISIYVWAENAEHAERARQLVVKVSESGYGKKKSVGYGQFQVTSFDPFTLTAPDDQNGEANGVVALGNLVPAPTGSRPFAYKTLIKYGRLGDGGIIDGTPLTPFKYPLIMLVAGATFTVNPSRRFLGRIVSPIHPFDQSLVQGAFSPVVPIKLPARDA